MTLHLYHTPSRSKLDKAAMVLEDPVKRYAANVVAALLLIGLFSGLSYNLGIKHGHDQTSEQLNVLAARNYDAAMRNQCVLAAIANKIEPGMAEVPPECPGLMMTAARR